MILFNLIIILIYLLFYINFFLSITFIPSIFLYLYNPTESIKYFILIKNILICSISFITKKILFPNIYVNSNNVINFNNFNNHYDIVGNKNLIISNHPMELDFLLGCIFYNNTNLFNTNIGIAKKYIGYQIPTLGFFGLLTGDIFLHRNINFDVNKLSKKINFNSMLIYPEGTCFNKNRKLISDNYCDINNLPKFKYHLYPRITGIDLILSNNPDIKYIYDLTIIYDEIKKNNYNSHYNTANYLLSKFKIPNKIFIQISKYKIKKYKNDIKNKSNAKMIENIYFIKDKWIDKFDLVCNNFIPIKYNYSKGLMCFLFVNFVSICSIYLMIELNFIKYLYIIQLIIYYVYFYIFV
jgi:1-acyl-sn-glycerol-3-phosphate acyltransferase